MADFLTRVLPSRKVKSADAIPWAQPSTVLADYPSWAAQETLRLRRTRYRLVQVALIPDAQVVVQAEPYPSYKALEALLRRDTKRHLVGLAQYPVSTPAPATFILEPDRALFRRDIKRRLIRVELNEYPQAVAPAAEFIVEPYPTLRRRDIARKLLTVELNEYPFTPPSAAYVYPADILLRANRIDFKVNHLWSGHPTFETGRVLFTMPVVGNFDTNAILHPGWLLFFTENGTGSAVDVYADAISALTHADPVRLDRYGNLPTIYLHGSLTYDLEIKNQFGVLRYTVTGFTV